jgi:hypothetical protein
MRVAAMACALSGALLTSCTQEKLDPLTRQFLSTPVDNFVQVNFCTDPAQEVRSKLKYIIILDRSGSNVQNYKIVANTGMPDLSTGGLDIQTIYATDPTKSARYGDRNIPGTFLHFLANLPANDPADPQIYFKLILFSNLAQNAVPANNGFMSNIPAFLAGVENARDTIGDQGSTNYLSTLTTTFDAIQADVNQARACAALSVTAAPTAQCPRPGVHVSSSYVIVYMSDGAPVMNVNVGTDPITVDRQSSREVLGSVAAIMGLQANTRYVDAINLFTVYYYNAINPDLTAQKLLEDMATVGNGVSYNVTSGSNIDYRRFTPPTKWIKFSLADIFVTNDNVVFDSEGRASRDSDMDGLADAHEAQLGSNANARDSDNDGVSDFVEFQMSGNPRNPTISRTNPVCAGLTGASDPNGLNDCEKAQLNNRSGVSLPDSNNDLIPDWLQFKNLVPFQVGTNSAQNTQESDGISYYQKIKTSLPARIPHYRLLNPQPSKYDMQLQSSSELQDCYRLNVRDLPTAGPDNQVRVDVILRSQLLQDRYLYRVGTKRFSGSSLDLRIGDWNDPTEVSASTWRRWP